MTAAIVRGGPGTIDETSLFLQSARRPCFRADGGEGRKDHGSFRSAPGRRRARGRPRGGACCERPDSPLEEGPLETGPLQTGPLQTAPQKAKPRQTALQKRAKHPAPAGRQITVHARPSYLTAGTQVPVGSVGNGYVSARSTSRRRSKAPLRACTAGSGSRTSSATRDQA